jgi:hypothetical protein
MWIQVKKTFPTKNVFEKTKDPGVLIGSRYYTHRDGPFEVDEEAAKRMILQGIVDAVVKTSEDMAERAIQPTGENRRIPTVDVAAAPRRERR